MLTRTKEDVGKSSFCSRGLSVFFLFFLSVFLLLPMESIGAVEKNQKQNIGARDHKNKEVALGIDPVYNLDPDYVFGRYILPGTIFLSVAVTVLLVLIFTQTEEDKEQNKE